MGDTPETFPVLSGLFSFYIVRAEYKQAHELGKQLLRLAQSRQDPALLLAAHNVMGNILFYLGELAADRTHLEHGSALYDSRQHHALAFSYGSVDLGVACLCYAAESVWYLGYPEQALERIQEALALAHALSHPFSLAYASTFAARLHQLRREGHAAQDRAEAVIALSTEQGFPYWLAEGTIFRGWALAEQGQGAEGTSQLREGLAAWRAAGSELWQSHFLALLAEAYGQSGQAEDGLRAVAEGLAFVERTEERVYEAELYRLKGELTLQSPVQGQKSNVKGQKPKVESQKPVLSGVEGSKVQAEAEEYFQQALTIARHQETKSWELRAATSLARLWQQQGKTAEARELLAPVYGWFTEGFDTADLKDAQSLLDE